MKVSELHAHFAQYFSQITKKLLDGSYQPQAVRKVQIPKSNGKMRVLGIPVARDRVIQQARTRVGAIDLSGEVAERKIGALQGRRYLSLTM
ncbi:hypothetical protein PQ751_10545 [Staphylococcus coagulans]|nr:hypothetical protein [Staphylococcus coagulans]MDU9281273.1 hypothetical protein [Staphylococcus coagulans]MDU9322870.1 hypothetical protein [Staphylococcus coagulans]